MWVEELRTDNPYHDIVKQACKEAGLPFNPDFNGAEQEGYNTVQVMMKNGERFHTGKAYINPHLGVRQNLTLMTDTHCLRVLFEGKRAVGVEVLRGGQRQALRCRREVIVSGGGILSAKLLLLSGVGPGADLQGLGITVVQRPARRRAKPDGPPGLHAGLPHTRRHEPAGPVTGLRRQLVRALASTGARDAACWPPTSPS